MECAKGRPILTLSGVAQQGWAEGRLRMTTETNKAVVRRYWTDVLGKRNFEQLVELFAGNFVSHAEQPQDLRSFRQALVALYGAFPDLQDTIDDVVAEADKVVVRFTAAGTQAGPFLGMAPTGKRIRAGGISIFRVAGGKIAERWSQFDEIGMLRQLGAVPASASAVPWGGREG